MFDKPSFGATKFEQDATDLKYTIDITGFDTDAIKVHIEIMFWNLMLFHLKDYLYLCI